MIRVNGRPHEVRATDSCPLLFVLRNELELWGPKLGCGEGDCGACAVLVDGREVRSCITPVGDVTGEVITLEGLGAMWGDATDGLHPVQRAWIDEQVPQCGHCQSGMMIAAVELLSRTPSPTRAQIKQAYSEPHPHLCRCGTYPAIIRAVERAAEEMR